MSITTQTAPQGRTQTHKESQAAVGYRRGQVTTFQGRKLGGPMAVAGKVGNNRQSDPVSQQARWIKIHQETVLPALLANPNFAGNNLAETLAAADQITDALIATYQGYGGALIGEMA